MQLPLPPHVQQQVHAAVSALQAEARWPGVRASGTGFSERQMRLGIRTVRALAEDLPPAGAPFITTHSPHLDSSSVEDAFAAGVGRAETAAHVSASRRLVHTRTVRALSHAALPSSNFSSDFAMLEDITDKQDVGASSMRSPKFAGLAAPASNAASSSVFFRRKHADGRPV